MFSYFTQASQKFKEQASTLAKHAEDSLVSLNDQMINFEQNVLDKHVKGAGSTLNQLNKAAVE